MKKSNKGQGNNLVLPPWIIAPTIFIGIPILAIIIISYPRALDYNYIPLPELSYKNNQYIEQLIKRTIIYKAQMKESDAYLIDALEDEGIAEYNTYKKIPIYNRSYIRGKLRLRIKDTISQHGKEHYYLLGDYLTLKFIVALKDLVKNKEEIIKLSGSFIEGAQKIGLIYNQSFIPPLAIAGVLFKLRWCTYIEEQCEDRLEPTEQIFLAIYRIKYQKALPLKLKIQSLNLICSHFPKYPCDITRAVIYKNHGDIINAKMSLISILSKDPFEIRARNLYLYLNRGEI